MAMQMSLSEGSAVLSLPHGPVRAIQATDTSLSCSAEAAHNISEQNHMTARVNECDMEAEQESSVCVWSGGVGIPSLAPILGNVSKTEKCGPWQCI